MKAQIEANQVQQEEWSVRTRRTNKDKNLKQIKQLKALDVQTTPVKDLPVDEDAVNAWSHSTVTRKPKKVEKAEDTVTKSLKS